MLRKERGITLIALVITIIVLLILAGVTIAMVVGDNGILTRAKEAKSATEIAEENEKRELARAEAAMNMENTTYEGVTIPAGFAPTRIDGENKVEDGLVITDSEGNEFVWIPINNIKEFYGKDINNQLHGKLYTYNSTSRENLNWSEENDIMTVSHTDSGPNTYREPSILKGGDTNDGDDGANGISSLKNIVGILGDSNDSVLNNWKEELESSFERMVNSAKKYNGFFVSRYEISYNNNKVESKKNTVAITSTSESVGNWYGLFQKAREYSCGNVKSYMIWGCQYDAILKYFQDNGIDVTKVIGDDINIDDKYTGVNEKDKIKNIYDLKGGRVEWTLESLSLERRTYRGGYFEVKDDWKWNIAHRGFNLNLSDSVYGRTTRMTLIIE